MPHVSFRSLKLWIKDDGIYKGLGQQEELKMRLDSPENLRRWKLF
jgi:hypothetical protein